MNMEEKIKQTAAYLQQKNLAEATVAVILGSGLGEFADELQNAVSIPYKEIPNFPLSTVQGHAGRLVFGEMAGKKVLAMQGRFHFYEGHPMETVVFPVRVMAAMGIRHLIVTNAAGGVNEQFESGNLMLITDHINFMGTNPLIGENLDFLGPRFPDMSHAYYEEGQKIARETAAQFDISLQQGVYAAFSGPSYETPAEVRMARLWGADAVGMSTVPEVIAANHAGMHVVGLSCITNKAAGLQSSLNHEEVMQSSLRVKDDFKKLLAGILAKI